MFIALHLFVEDSWLEGALNIGAAVRVEGFQPTLWCVTSTLAQQDLPRDLSILRTTAQHHRGCLGVYATVTRSGLLRVGLSPGRRFYKSHQVVPPERLGEKSGGAPAHRFFPIGLTALCTDKYDRHLIVSIGKPLLQFEACDARQLHVHDQAGSPSRGTRCQKLLGRIEAFHGISCRFHAVSERFPHKHVVIDNRDAAVQYVAQT